MEVINTPPPPCVLTVGKFEGIHRGHRALIDEVAGRANREGLASVVMVFEPHPAAVLHDPGYKPLFTEAERVYLLGETGIDYLLTQPFDTGFAAISPNEFCRKLFRSLNAKIIIIGEDYRFGRGRAGTVETLRKAAAVYGGEVCVVPALASRTKTCDEILLHRQSLAPNCAGFLPQDEEQKPPHTQRYARFFATKYCDKNTSKAAQDFGGGVIISTSTIRGLVAACRLAEAERLLGFPFFVMGTVEKGRQLGRRLGFPTLNLYPPGSKFLPPDGVYATSTVLNGVKFPGITNIGLRPTVTSPGENVRRSVETHLFETLIDRELYGSHIKTEFQRFIRPERRFENEEDLKKQVMEDLRGLGKD